MSAPDHEAFETSFETLAIDSTDPSMAQTRAMALRGEVIDRTICPGKFPGEPNLRYKIITNGAFTTDIPNSLDSPGMAFKYLDREGRTFRFSGTEHWTVRFGSRHTIKCDCQNWSVASPCSHVFYALNQLIRLEAKFHHAEIPDGAQIESKLPVQGEISGSSRTTGPEAILVVNGEGYPIWPHDILKPNSLQDGSILLQSANAFIQSRTRSNDFDQAAARMDRELQPGFLPTDFEANFPDPCARVREGNSASIRKIIAEVCASDDKWEREFLLIMTPATKAAIRLEQIENLARRCVAALDASPFQGVIFDTPGRVHERQVKRALEECAYAIYEVYTDLIRGTSEDDILTDLAKATRVAISGLTFMIRSVLERNRPIADSASLWAEMTRGDVDLRDQGDFWTCVRATFQEITPAGMTNAERSNLRKIYRFARDYRLQGSSGSTLLLVLDDISRGQ